MKVSHWTLLVALGFAWMPAVAAAQDETPAPEAQEETPAAEAMEDPASSASVARSAICTGIEEHEPVGEASVFPAGTEQLFCFSQIRGAKGQKIIHAWIHEGTTRARVELTVGSDLWRTHSSKTLLPSWTGAWQVKILTEAGAVLQTIDFRIGDEP